MQGGRRTTNAVWRVQVRQVAAGADSRTQECFWSLRKCDEHVQHDLVHHEARAKEYPFTLLRVSLASYWWLPLIGMFPIMGRGSS
jgi:hypothetical protein